MEVKYLYPDEKEQETIFIDMSELPFLFKLDKKRDSQNTLYYINNGPYSQVEKSLKENYQN